MNYIADKSLTVSRWIGACKQRRIIMQQLSADEAKSLLATWGDAVWSMVSHYRYALEIEKNLELDDGTIGLDVSTIHRRCHHGDRILWVDGKNFQLFDIEDFGVDAFKGE